MEWVSQLRRLLGCAGLLLGLSLGAGAQAPQRDLTDLSLEELQAIKVTSASLHDQSLADAPASVTVITAEEIRKFGYRTLAEALSYVRGFFTYTDHTYTYLGARGFSLPGDFDTRLIVMINGHSIADNIFDQSPWFGNDFPVDMEMVERIEVLRGPSSALYGSNGMLATINVITRRPAEAAGAQVRVEAGSLGERKAGVATSVALPGGANLLVSASVFQNSGAEQLYFQELDTPQTNFGRAFRVDGEKGYHAFADLTWGNWELLAVAGDRMKQQPVSWGDIVFGDRGTRAEDSRAFAELSYTRNLSGDRTFDWRVSYDAYRYRGIYHYKLPDGVEDDREHDYGDWLGTKMTYRMPDGPNGHLTLGTEFRVDLRALQNVFDVAPVAKEYLNINHRDRYAAVFAQQEWELGQRWEIGVGARFDWSWLRRSAISPRFSVIYKPTPGTDLKVLYSRGFRNPSAYDMFYTDNGLTQIANPALQPETVDSYELDFDRQVHSRVRIGATAYHYRVDDLIQQIFTPEGLDQFVNQDRVRAWGGSLELGIRLPARIDLVSSLAIQRAVMGNGAVLANSPGQVGKLRLSMPLWRDRLSLSAGLQALGQRNTYAGYALPWVILPEAALTTRPLVGGLAFGMGVKNLSNSFYRDPSGLNPAVDSMIGAGRSYFLTMTWKSSETDTRRSHAK